MFSKTVTKKRVIGALLLAVILILFLSFNRFPKLDAVGTDLEAITGPDLQCFQGFCIERDSGDTTLSRWWSFSITYLRLVAVGMIFAFVVAGLAESFLFPPGSGSRFSGGNVFKRTLMGAAMGPVMNLCSACIVPVSSAFQRKGLGMEGAISLVQGSATMNIPALAMVFFIFAPLLGFSRLFLAVIGALIIGPIVVLAMRKSRHNTIEETGVINIRDEDQVSEWRPVLIEGFRDWGKSSFGYLVRLGPIMVVAGFASGLVIQWISPETVAKYLGNDLMGVAIAATLGIMINVPLLFEIPLVALLLLLGMGTAPAATLLFTAAAGGPITFWGLAKMMPKRAIATFAMTTWTLGAIGGLAVLGVGTFIWDDISPLSSAVMEASGGVANQVKIKVDIDNQSTIRANRFTDVTTKMGVNFVHHVVSKEPVGKLEQFGAGVVIFDVNNDGFQDIYVPVSEGPNALYLNNGGARFEEMAGIAGIADPGGIGNGGCASDYDNDGYQDLYVTNFGPDKLYKNNGDSTFVDVTVTAGVQDAVVTHRSMGCAWGDYDQDGYTDFIVVRHLKKWESEWEKKSEFIDAVGSLALFHNNGQGGFTNVTHLLGDTSGPNKNKGETVGNLWGAGFQPVWVDFDNDGDLDLYVVNDFGYQVQPNVLWRNDGSAADGTWSFVDVSTSSGAGVSMSGMGLAVGDYNLDGSLDFFMTNIGQNTLLKNNGDGQTFTISTLDSGVGVPKIGRLPRVAWGTVFFDYDNDGDEDLYVVSGFMHFGTLLSNPQNQPNVLLRNNGEGTFTDVSMGSGADDAGIGRGGVYLDFNRDGCLDLFVANLRQKAKLLKNDCASENNWLAIKVVGVTSNRDGIGSRITVMTDGIARVREVSSGSSQMGQNMMMVHFGLGTATMADSITIRWPSGKVQVLTDVQVNQLLTVTEPE